jgi:hypothetical protein
MNKFFLLLLTLIGVICGLFVETAVAQRVISIFSEVDSGSELSVAQKDQSDRVYLDFNFDGLKQKNIQKGDLIEFNFGGEMVQMVVSRAEQYTPGTYSVIARNPDSREMLVFTVTDSERVFGKIHLRGHETYHLDYDSGQNAVYKQLFSSDEHDILLCGQDELTVPAEFELLYKSSLGKTSVNSASVPNSSAIAANQDDEITIDLLIVYSQSAVEWSFLSTFGGIQNVIAQSMALSQAALDNSDVDVKLRLVHSTQIDYTENPLGESAEDILRKLTASPSLSLGSQFDGSMDAVHDLREQFGADLVAGFFSSPNDAGGIAWRLGNQSGNPQFGFSVNRVQQMANTYTLVHEIGHNVGISHARNQTASPAAGVGGLFEYSAGYRTGSGFEGFNTIMAYAEGIQNEAPLFSSPDLTFMGAPAGNRSDFVTGYTDARRNWREIKSIIANYRPTRFEPPALTQNMNHIELTLDRDVTQQIPVTLSNTGSSDLMWSINFSVPESAILVKQSAKSGPILTGIQNDVNPVILNSVEMPIADEDGVIYQTDFESYVAEVATFSNEWRSSNDSERFQISTQNPSAGSKHLRFPINGDGDGTIFLRSPNFGRQAYGEIEVSMDVSFNHTTESGSWERFDVYFSDSALGGITAGLVFGEDGVVFAYNGNNSFQGTSLTYVPNTYYTVKIRFNVNTGSVEYYVDGIKISDQPLAENASIDHMNLISFNTQTTSYMDLDNFEYKRVQLFDWMEVDTYAGVVKPGESHDFNLDFNTRGVPAGTYEVSMILNTNDPIQPINVIPIRLNVLNSVSVDDVEQIPDRIALNQNYPNPFNPTTTISYALPNAGLVRLEVFDLLGRSVSLLVNETVEAGSHTVRFDASSLSSGVYVYRLTTDAQVLTRQMVLVR